ncbi:hypothetical protein P3S67_005549 [Capsicum chacoense]
MDTTSPMAPCFENGLLIPLPVISPWLTTILNEKVTNDMPKLMDLASAAMNELLRLAEIDEPLCVRSLDGGGEILNLEEYAKSFIPLIGMKPGHFRTEATRASGTVINSLALVETLTDKCGGRNGTLQLQHGEGIWAVVDVSIDTISEGSEQCEIGSCRRLPSGCIIQD